MKQKYLRFRNKFHRDYIQKIKLKFVQWWDMKHPGKYCWADCVSWAFDPEQWNPYEIGNAEGCEVDSNREGHGTCYCGAWGNGVCFASLPKSEQERIINEQAA